MVCWTAEKVCGLSVELWTTKGMYSTTNPIRRMLFWCDVVCWPEMSNCCSFDANQCDCLWCEISFGLNENTNFFRSLVSVSDFHCQCVISFSFSEEASDFFRSIQSFTVYNALHTSEINTTNFSWFRFLLTEEAIAFHFFTYFGIGFVYIKKLFNQTKVISEWCENISSITAEESVIQLPAESYF